jgi:septation ring formation regulator EzrA
MSVHMLGERNRDQEITIIARCKIDSDEKIDLVYEILEDEMQACRRFVSSKKRQYLNDIKRILANQCILTV